MKKTLLATTLTLCLCTTTQGLTLDDAIYKGSGSDVKEVVTFEAIPFGTSTLTFTVDAAILGGAADKYNGQSVVLGYATADIVAYDPAEPYLTIAIFASFQDDYVYFYANFISGDSIPTVPTMGGNGFSVDTILGQNNLAFTLWGLTPVSIRHEYQWKVTVPPTASLGNSIVAWKNVTVDDFSGIAFSSLHLNTEFVNSYYVFDKASTNDEARLINLEAAKKAPSIPEPTTATLSLLALAALAARRRR